jgi:hypothetical protein
VPTLVISVRNDLFNTLPVAEFAASIIPGAKLVVYETGSHLLVGRHHEVRSVVTDFLAKHAHSTRQAADVGPLSGYSRSATKTSTGTKLTLPMYLISITAAPWRYRNSRLNLG